MKKIALHCLQLLAIISVVSLASCGSSDPVIPAAPSTITVQADPTATYATNPKFEKGEKVKIKVKASVPGGVQIFQIKRKVGSGAETDVTTAYTSQGLPAAGATSYEKVFEVTVAETFNATTPAENKVVFTFNVKNSQATTFTTGSFSYDVAAQGQGGGGGIAPLLRAIVQVGLGAQLATAGSYLASSAGANGLYTSAEAAALSSAAKQLIDITFGVVGTDGNSAAGAAATTPQIISPDTRASKMFNNPLGTDAKATTFKSSTLTALTAVTSTDVNNLDHSTASVKFTTIAAGNVISFVNAQGAKGYVRVVSITGTGDSRTATLDVLVQQIQ